ncbi:hypothetical protein [Streptomyces sp. NPDC020298]|uniref:hypothetical protein n=1 Tax=unclassified Streptomyces TaxID=2593676 RepID=UPI0033DF1488
MDALTPPTALQPPTHAPAPPAPMLVGPVCAACGAEAVVHWLRRPMDDELAAVIATERGRREQLMRVADPQLPAPVFGPPPSGDDMTVTVYACSPHAITLEAAAHIHASSCTAPNEVDLPSCDCTPEVRPQEPLEEPVRALPTHWVTGGA